MDYRIEGMSLDGQSWVRKFDPDVEPYGPIRNMLVANGYVHAETYPPQRGEFWMMVDFFEPRCFDRVPCTNQSCVGGFIRVGDKYRLCETCEGNATIYVDTLRGLDKLIEGLNL